MSGAGSSLTDRRLADQGNFRWLLHPKRASCLFGLSDRVRLALANPPVADGGPAAIDNLQGTTLNELYPFLPFRCSRATGSRLTVVQSGCMFRHRLLMLGLAEMILVLSGTPEASAAGCHGPDRPVLARSLAWESWLGVGNSPAAVRAAPPVLVPLPCHGETPSTPDGGVSLPNPAAIAAMTFFPPVPRERMTLQSGDASPRLIASRLERPPRRTSASPSTAD
jgi:hypothetical protein